MAFIPVPEVAQVKLIYTVDRQVAINDLYFSFGSTPSATDLDLLAEGVATWWAGAYGPFVCDTVTLNRVEALDLSSNVGAFGSHASGITGTITSEMAPSNVAPCISFRTGFRGRSFRGRNYLVGVPNSEVDVNTLTPEWQASMIAAYQQFIDKTSGISNPAWDWCVVSRFTSGGPRTTGIFTFVQSVLFTDNIVDSQRRRLPGRGA